MDRSSRQSGTAAEASCAQTGLLHLPGVVDRPDIIHRIQRLICGKVHAIDLQEDLLQECLLLLWRVLSRHPDKTLGWCLKRRRWHVADWLKHGRSLDSIKNRAHQCVFDPEDGNPFLMPVGGLVSGDDVIQEVSVQDMIRELSRHLVSPDTDVLHLLAEGYRPYEIACELHLPPREVSRSRARIAEVALDFRLRSR